MKSGLEDRNNMVEAAVAHGHVVFVSMKSGLEGRNNGPPEAYNRMHERVSMKSGLEGRNNELNENVFTREHKESQ